jgi:hypothetical protein
MEIEDDLNDFEYLERITKEALEKYQRHTMALKKMLNKQEESETTQKVISEQRTQLEEKEEEIKRLMSEIISQVE